MKLQDEQAKTKMLNRLRRIEGQVRGLQSMVTDERDCREILQQMTAARSAFQSVMQLFLEEYATDCLINLDDKDKHQRQNLAKELVNMLSKTP